MDRQMIIDKLPELNNYHREKYQGMTQSEKRKAETESRFADELSKSIEKYREY